MKRSAAEPIHLLRQALHPPLDRLLRAAIDLATARGTRLYLVGGPVRDALLKRPITDLDLVIEPDAWPLAEAFQAALGGTLTRHALFRTATVEVEIGGVTHAVDFVTARRETYAAPAALPDVTPAAIEDDLRRRDFTINTLALRLNPEPVAMLDPFHGVDDLHARIVRVLHDASFEDDPTRIVRAARFTARLGYAVDQHTRTLIGHALDRGMITRTTPQRMLNEIWLLLDEPQPEHALAALHGWQALDQLALPWSDTWAAQFPAARAADRGECALHEVYTGLLIWAMTPAQRAAFARRYNLPGWTRRLLAELPGEIPALLLADAPTPAALEQALRPYSPAAIQTLRLVAPSSAVAQIDRYLHTIRSLTPLLSGDDLRSAGIAPGPIYRALLDDLRRLQLDGTLATRDDALRWLRERVT